MFCSKETKKANYRNSRKLRVDEHCSSSIAINKTIQRLNLTNTKITRRYRWLLYVATNQHPSILSRRSRLCACPGVPDVGIECEATRANAASCYCCATCARSRQMFTFLTFLIPIPTLAREAHLLYIPKIPVKALSCRVAQQLLHAFFKLLVPR
jgi:hypothetical protein